MGERIKYLIYRWFMRFAHKHNWHYAPRIGPLEDGATQLWCKWCGFRETFRPSIDPHPLSAAGISKSKWVIGKPDIENRCAICGWPLAESADKGCTRGNCSMRPFPSTFFDPARANQEYGKTLRPMSAESQNG